MRTWALVAVAAVAGCHGKPATGPLQPLPKAAYAHYLDGMLDEYAEDWPGAIAAFQAAAVAAPDEPMIAVELASVQVKGKQLAAARDTLDEARERWPGHSQVWLASGELFERAATGASPKAAIGAYRRAVALAPDDEAAYLGLARLQRPTSARATLRTLVERVPDSTDGHYRLGVNLALARSEPGAMEAAIAQFRAVLERDPDHLDARLDLARGLRIVGKIDEAVAQTRSAFDRSGQALDIAEELFWLLCEADDRIAAIDLLTLLDDDRSDLDALAAVARFQRVLGRLPEARELATKIAKQDADAGAVAAAAAALAASEYESAAWLAMAVPITSDELADARKLAITALLALGRAQDALDAAAPVRAAASPHAKAPGDLELALLVATAQVDLRESAAARATLAPFGGTPAAILARARLAEHAGDPAGALALIEPVARAHPELAAPQNLAAYLLAKRGERLSEAEAWARRARELAPGDPAILDTWGYVRWKQGQAREAVRVLLLATRIAPLEAEIAVHLAAAWAADGAPRKAAEVLDHVSAELHPSPAIAIELEAVRRSLPRQ